MASSKSTTFEKVLQQTGLESVPLSLLCGTYNQFICLADHKRAEWPAAGKKPSTPEMITKTWAFEDTQLSSLPVALRPAHGSTSRTWQQRRNPLFNYEDDSFCKMKIDTSGVIITQHPRWPPYFLGIVEGASANECAFIGTPYIFGRPLIGPESQDDQTCPGLLRVTLTVTSLPFKTSAEVSEFLEFTMMRMITAKSLKDSVKQVADLEKELAEESKEREKCSAELQQLSSAVIKCATRLRKAAVVGADRLPKDHRKNAGAAIDGAVITACDALAKQKSIADEELREKLQEAEAQIQSLKLSNDQLTEALDHTSAQVTEKDAAIADLEEQLEEQLECRYCWDKKVDQAFACGHVCCKECADKMRAVVNEDGEMTKGCPAGCTGQRSGKPIRHCFKLYF